MKNLMYELVCSDIRIIELKLKRIRISRKHLLKKKPSILNKKKLVEWKGLLNQLENEEEEFIKELQCYYKDLEKYL